MRWSGCVPLLGLHSLNLDEGGAGVLVGLAPGNVKIRVCDGQDIH